MTYAEAIERLGLNQSSAARMLGISVQASARFARDEKQPPRAVTILLALMVRFEVDPASLGTAPPVARKKRSSRVEALDDST